MNTNYAWVLILSIGVAALMWNLAGVDTVLDGPSPAGDLQSGSELEDEAPDQPRLNGSADSSAGEGDIVGLVISGAKAVSDFIGMVVLLPIELQRIGFPQWFAYPIGLAAQIFAAIGLVQFATNRELR